MHIDNGNMILFNKKAQKLDTVKTPEQFTERELTRALRDAINAENEAIKQYETIVDATNDENIKKALQDISDEERVHVGELQCLLKMILDDEKELLEEGEREVKEDILEEEKGEENED